MNAKPKFFPALLVVAALIGFGCGAQGADKYAGTCNVVFEGDSTLHAFTGDITNITLVVFCDTNTVGVATVSTRIELAPKQLSTHSTKRDANMYEMFKSDRFPKLIVVVTNALLAAAKLSPNEANTSGVLPVQLTFCGITKEVLAKTSNSKKFPDGWEFDLQTDLSLKAFKLEPPSVMFGAISVADAVKVKAHIKVQKEIFKP